MIYSHTAVAFSVVDGAGARVARVPANSAAAGRWSATPLHLCERAMFLRRVDVIVRNDALERRVSTRLLPSVTRFPDGARTAPHAWGPSKRRNATAGRVLVRVLLWPSRSGSGGKNQWGWGDFTTRDLKRRQHIAA